MTICMFVDEGHVKSTLVRLKDRCISCPFAIMVSVKYLSNQCRDKF